MHLLADKAEAERKTALAKFYHCVRFKFLKIMVEILCFFLQKQVEFLVEYADTEKAASKPVNFNVTPETLQNIREVSNENSFASVIAELSQL